MNFDLKFYWRLFLRRLPAMTAIVIVCSGIGVVAAMRAPTTFETEARLLVEDPQIPGELAASTVRTEANAAIEIIRQRLMTRANMLDIANDFDVFPNYSEMSPDVIVRQMEEATSIRSQGGGRGGDPVVVTLIRACGQCPSCGAGRPTGCETPQDDEGQDDPGVFRGLHITSQELRNRPDERAEGVLVLGRHADTLPVRFGFWSRISFS